MHRRILHQRLENALATLTVSLTLLEREVCGPHDPRPPSRLPRPASCLGWPSPALADSGCLNRFRQTPCGVRHTLTSRFGAMGRHGREAIG